MKKAVILLFILLCLCGCASPAPSAEKQEEVTDRTLTADPAPESEELLIIGVGEEESAAPEEISRSYGFDDLSEFDVSKLHYEDFDELYGQLMFEGLPEGIVREPLKYANGVWKYDLKIRYDSSDGYLFDELGYAEMSVDGTQDPPVRITLHPRLASDGIAVWEESDQDVGYEPFAGGLDDNDDLKLFGNNCVMLLTDFYAYEGREYLIAQLWMSEEDVAVFMMIRGQE
ncbi:MAG: hypothetical protein IIZ28_07970 [Erysipelotrichaceae bacterium]|nr:hypothetical protein [Erysipelotrichaceae bacterium]